MAFGLKGARPGQAHSEKLAVARGVRADDHAARSNTPLILEIAGREMDPLFQEWCLLL